MRTVVIVILGLLGSLAAAQVLEGFEDPAMQARYTQFIETIRCMKCQNQSIAKSPADQATDIKQLIREMMAKRRSKTEIQEFLDKNEIAYEKIEAFDVTLSNPSGGAVITAATAAGVIRNDDAPPQLSIGAVSACG